MICSLSVSPTSLPRNVRLRVCLWGCDGGHCGRLISCVAVQALGFVSPRGKELSRRPGERHTAIPTPDKLIPEGASLVYSTDPEIVIASPVMDDGSQMHECFIEIPKLTPNELDCFVGTGAYIVNEVHLHVALLPSSPSSSGSVYNAFCQIPVDIDYITANWLEPLQERYRSTSSTNDKSGGGSSGGCGRGDKDQIWCVNKKKEKDEKDKPLVMINNTTASPSIFHSPRDWCRLPLLPFTSTVSTQKQNLLSVSSSLTSNVQYVQQETKEGIFASPVINTAKIVYTLKILGKITNFLFTITCGKKTVIRRCFPSSHKVVNIEVPLSAFGSYLNPVNKTKVVVRIVITKGIASYTWEKEI